MDLSPVSREPMRPPAPFRLLAGSLLVALVLNLLPWSGWALSVRPDFMLLVLLHWSVHQPRSIGQGWGFFFGLVMDVADSVLLGQHSLAYVASIYLAQKLRLRLLSLTVLEQALHLLAILFLAQGVLALLNLSLGRGGLSWLAALSPLIGALLWPVVNFVATLPRLNRTRAATTVMH